MAGQAFGVMARVRIGRMLMLLLPFGALCTSGCAGRSSASTTASAHQPSSASRTESVKQSTSSTTSTASSGFSAGARLRLTAGVARRIAEVCSHDETSEDQNVIDQFANRGYSITSPAVLTGLKTAAHDVAHESAQVKAAGRSSVTLNLSEALSSEAQALKDASGFRHARSDEQLLLSALHRRIAVANTAGVTSCEGAAPNTLRPAAPS